MRETGQLDRARRLMSAYYGNGVDGDRDSSRLQSAGEQGEVTDLHVNMIRPVLTNALSIVAGVRPGVKPVATNSSMESAAQTRLAEQLNDYYLRKLSIPSLEVEAVRGGFLAGAWSLIQNWVTSAGKEVAFDAEAGRMLHEGDIETWTSPPWRTFYDPTPSTDAGRQWLIFRRRQARHDLIARAKDEWVKEKLAAGGGQPGSSTRDNPWANRLTAVVNGLDGLLGEQIWNEDEVWVWEVRHLPSPALPMGRLVRFVEPDVIIYDSFAAGEPANQGDSAAETPESSAVAYPFEELHAYEYAPERIVGQSAGHSLMFDTLALQEFHDLCTASIATTVNLMGMPHVWSRRGGAPQVHQLSTGPTVIETDERPQIIDLPALKPEVMQAADWAQSMAEKAAALNATVMGNPEKGMPASAQALQRAQAVQYHQVSQDEWVRLVEKNANGRLRMLKRFARENRVAEIAGTAGAWEVRHWKAEDIAGVERFQVEKIDPMSSTFEGRQAIAEKLGVQGDALLDFLQTGSLKKVTETRTQQLELVERNKALLQQGIGLPPIDEEASLAAGRPVFLAPQGEEKFVSVLKSDPHHLAIPAYLSVVNSPEVRTSQPEIIVPVLDVVTESLRLWLTLTPDELAAFQIPPLPSSAMLAMGALPPGAQQAVAQNQGDASKPPVEQNVDLPSPPQNPLTGAEADAGALSLA